MPDKSKDPFLFWQELKRRRVIRVIPVYAAAAFVLLELVDIISEPLGLPDWTINFVLVLLGIGFIIAIILSWVYDITPEGIERTKPSKEVDESQKPTTSKVWKVISFISILIIIGFILFYIVGNIKQSSDISKLEKSIAVLPFKSLSNDPDKQYLADGVMDAILLHLSKIEDLRVMSRTSVEQYRETDKTATMICQELNVSYLLEGSFQKHGDKARLIVQLIIPGKEGHVWADQYDRDWKDIFSVQSEVAQSIARELKAVITPEVKQLIENVPTSNMLAYDFHLQAKDLYYKYLSNWDNRFLDTIAQVGHELLALDPEFAMAYYWLGAISFSSNRITTFYLPFYLDTALFFFNKAIELDSTLIEAYAARGMYYYGKAQMPKAMDDLKKAIRLDPNYSIAYIQLGIVFQNSRDYINALTNFKKAEELEMAGRDLDIIYLNMWYTYTSIGDQQKAELISRKFQQSNNILFYLGKIWKLTIQGKYEELLAIVEKAISYQPEFEGWYVFKSNALLGLGRVTEAEESIRIALEHSGINMNDTHRVGIILWENGKKDEAMEYFNKQIRYCNESIRQKNNYGITNALYDLAGVYAFLGNREKALHWLREYEKLGFAFGLHKFIKVDQLFDSLRNDAEFKEIVKRANDEKAEIRARINQMEEQGML